MLYGHIETSEERVDHMLRARALQEETGGFQAFIPLAFHPDNNQMRKLPAPSAADSLRVHAVSRLMLDNIPHVKAFWIATGVEVAQTSLWFGVDDLDGTVQEERIYHMAMCLELDSRGIPFESEKVIEVKYRDWTIPGQRLDLLVAGAVVVEVKAIPDLKPLHRRQVVSYLKAAGFQAGLLLNFNTTYLKMGIRRVVRTG